MKSSALPIMSKDVVYSPPLGNNTNPDDKLEFVFFFSNEYFGIKVDLNSKKKNQPGV